MGQQQSLVNQRHSLLNDRAIESQKLKQSLKEATIKGFNEHIENNLVRLGSVEVQKDKEEMCCKRWLDGWEPHAITYCVSKQELQQMLDKKKFNGVRVDETHEKITLSIE